ncbi:MurR/RpiR family transcriptional regulator [Amycolatopsis methanolica]|uniref:RpiR family transcriptional regulator n=1 Tax=Amycolatopsis methanolica 239 TaxID=1068978 RepID=A0A076MN02_AMYME|nr:MurR/RpiR family transcriptional regulator [Amycolatopsis methanolica]AIJ22223.1 RpiR family transcriptional regulator [Amycolatopsis methanolica 239]
MTGGIDEASWVPGSVAERARAAQVLLARGSDVVRMSVSEIAAAAGTGVGTVVRTCQSLGFKGVQDAKIALAQNLAPLVIDRGDSPADVLAKLAASSADALQRARSSVDAAALKRAAGMLAAATRVLVLGVGTSAPLAQDAAYWLLTLGIAAEAPADVHVQHVRAGLPRPGDVVVAVSHTGATRETVSADRRATESGAAVVAVTSFATTPLTEVADAALVAGGLETRCRVEAMTSRLAHLVVLDALFVSLLLAEPARSAEAQALVADVLSEHRF